jgi:regulator of replication initiation timing
MPYGYTTAYEGLKKGKEILKEFLDFKADALAKERVNSVMAELGVAQDALFEMREELFRLQAENQELNDKLINAENWEARLQEYELIKTEGGAVVYGYKSEPQHFACPCCIEKKSIQILQDTGSWSGKYHCVSCQADFLIGKHNYSNLL